MDGRFLAASDGEVESVPLARALANLLGSGERAVCFIGIKLSGGSVTNLLIGLTVAEVIRDR